MPKIIIFDQDSMLGMMYETKFRLMGWDAKFFNVLPANVVEVVALERPDIISMDIIMKDIDGFSATRLLKSDPRTQGIPLFFLSNLGQADDIEKGMALGAVDYFVKARFMPGEIVDRALAILRVPAPKPGPTLASTPSQSTEGKPADRHPERHGLRRTEGRSRVSVPLPAFIAMLVLATLGLLMFVVLLIV